MLWNKDNMISYDWIHFNSLYNTTDKSRYSSIKKSEGNFDFITKKDIFEIFIIHLKTA